MSTRLTSSTGSDLFVVLGNKSLIQGTARHTAISQDRINLSGARRKNYGPPIRTPGGTLRLAKAADGTAAKSLVAGTTCPARRDGDDLTFSLPELGRFEVVVIK